MRRAKRQEGNEKKQEKNGPESRLNWAALNQGKEILTHAVGTRGSTRTVERGMVNNGDSQPRLILSIMRIGGRCRCRRRRRAEKQKSRKKKKTKREKETTLGIFKASDCGERIHLTPITVLLRCLVRVSWMTGTWPTGRFGWAGRYLE